MTLRKFWIASLLLTLSVSAAQAKQKYQAPLPLSPEQSALVKKAIAAEKVTVREIRSILPWCRPTSKTCVLTRLSMPCRYRTSTFLAASTSAKPSRTLLLKGAPAPTTPSSKDR